MRAICTIRVATYESSKLVAMNKLCTCKRLCKGAEWYHNVLGIIRRREDMPKHYLEITLRGGSSVSEPCSPDADEVVEEAVASSGRRARW